MVECKWHGSGKGVANNYCRVTIKNWQGENKWPVTIGKWWVDVREKRREWGRRRGRWRDRRRQSGDKREGGRERQREFFCKYTHSVFVIKCVCVLLGINLNLRREESMEPRPSFNIASSFLFTDMSDNVKSIASHHMSLQCLCVCGLKFLIAVRRRVDNRKIFESRIRKLCPTTWIRSEVKIAFVIAQTEIM